MESDDYLQNNAVQYLIALAHLDPSSQSAFSLRIESDDIPQDWQVSNGEWHISMAEQEEWLREWKSADQDGYDRFHRMLLRELSHKLVEGKSQYEPQWDAVFERVANFLGTQDAEKLNTLLSDIQTVPLQNPLAQQRRAFYEANLFFVTDQLDIALDKFNQLLWRPGTLPYIRARTLNGIGVTYRLQGEFEKALNRYQQSLDLWEELGDQYYTGLVLINIGITYFELQLYDETKRYLIKAKPIFETLKDETNLASINNELGLLARQRGDWDEAAGYFNALVELGSARRRDLLIGIGSMNRGEIYLFQGKLSEGERSLRQALAHLQSIRYQIDVYLFLGLLYQTQRQLDQAKEAFETALALTEQIERKEILPTVLFHLGKYYEFTGSIDKARSLYESAIKELESHRAPIKKEEIRMSLFGSRLQIFEALILLEMQAGRFTQAFERSEQARARTYFEGVSNKRVPAAVSVTTLQSSLEPNEQLLIYFTIGVLESDIPMWAALPKDNPLREFVLIPPHTARFSISEAQFQGELLPLDPNALSVKGSPQRHIDRLLATQFRKRLGSLLLPTIEDRSIVTIIPHGPLHYIPFSALSVSKHVVIYYAPSGSIWHDLKRTRKNIETSNRNLALGYNGVDSKMRLKFAELEATYLCEKFGYKLHDNQLSIDLSEAVVDSTILHFACHGWFNYEDPMSSYLEIGPTHTVSARQILSDWKLNCDLVVLSACHTGTSRLLRGDEPMGLVRAFLYAGAKSVLVTQWSVDDLATFIFMMRLNELLFSTQEVAKMSVGQILNETQQWLMEQTAFTLIKWFTENQVDPPEELSQYAPEEKIFADPIYWGGFQLVGS